MIKQWLHTIYKFKIPYLGIALLVPLLLVRDKLLYSDLSICKFDALLPAIATFENVDISKRVWLFYGSFFILFGGILILSFLAFVLRRRFNMLKFPLKAVNQLSFFGILFLFYELIGFPQIIGLKLIFSLITCVIVYYTAVSATKSRIIRADQNILYWLGTLSFSLSFLIREVAFWLGFQDISIMLVFVMLFFVLITMLLIALEVFRLKFKTLFNGSLPLFFIPFLSVLSDETYLILNQRNIHLLSPNLFYLIWIALLVTFLLVWHKKKRQTDRSLEQTLNLYIFPTLLAGILVFVFYQPFINQPTELFELANPANGMMRLFEFGQTPILEAFGSHVLSDFGLMPLYSLLNGYDGSLSFLIYGGIADIVFWLIFYFFLCRIFRSGILAFSTILLIPFIHYFFMNSYFMIFAITFLFAKLYRTNSIKTMVFIELVTLFSCLWKIELGISAIAITTILFTSYLIHGRFRKKQMLDFVKSIALILAVCATAVIVLIAFTRIDIHSNFKQALDYLGASQAHGLPIVTLSYNRIYYLHYYLFPAISTLLLIFYLVRLNVKKVPKGLFFDISMVSMLVFYFINTQRGLVRHSLAETNESFISSFFYLIIVLFVWDIAKQNRKLLILIPFVMTLVVFVFRKGEDTDLISNYTQFTSKFHANDSD